jgi:hypothetical protein
VRRAASRASILNVIGLIFKESQAGQCRLHPALVRRRCEAAISPAARSR